MAKFEKIFGKHSVKAVLLQRPQDIETIILAGKPEYYADIIEEAEKNNIGLSFVDWSEFVKAGEFREEDKHQGVMAKTQPRQIYGINDLDRLRDANCVLILDQISNPQNFATIIRCASFFKADAICFMRNRAADVSPTVVRYAVGGAEFVDFYQVVNVSHCLSGLKDLGYWVYGLDERGEQTLAQCDLAEKTAFVIGAEGEGLRQKTKRYCDMLLKVPGGRHGVESLNAAIATALALYEFGREET